jgi:hypothetical protein
LLNGKLIAFRGLVNRPQGEISSVPATAVTPSTYR